MMKVTTYEVEFRKVGHTTPLLTKVDDAGDEQAAVLRALEICNLRIDEVTDLAVRSNTTYPKGRW